MTNEQILVFMAKQFEGVLEEKFNAGPLIKKFQKAVDGKSNNEPWCLAFCMHVIKETQKALLIIHEKPISEPKIFFTEHCMTCWNKTPKGQRLDRPEVGSIMIMQRWENGKGTDKGHAGIVVSILDENTFQTIEGNTSSDLDDREGEGIFIKTRHLTHHAGKLRPVGFLKVW